MSWISHEYQKLDRSPRALRRFGILVGAALLLLGGFPLLDGKARGLILLIGTLLLLAAAFAPSILRYLYRPWMTMAFALSWLFTRVILTLVYFLIVTPVGLLQRLCGKRALEFRFKSDESTYWQPRTEHPTPADYERQF